MPAKSKWDVLEAEKGKRIDLIIRDAYAKHGQQKAVAQELGVAPSTLKLWLLKLGLHEKTILVVDANARYEVAK